MGTSVSRLSLFCLRVLVYGTSLGLALLISYGIWWLGSAQAQDTHLVPGGFEPMTEERAIPFYAVDHVHGPLRGGTTWLLEIGHCRYVLVEQDGAIALVHAGDCPNCNAKQ